MTERDHFTGFADHTRTSADWRSECEKTGWCRCGKKESEPSPGCEWHQARNERTPE